MQKIWTLEDKRRSVTVLAGLLTVEEAAKLLEIDRMRVYRLIHAGKLPITRIGTAIRVFVGDVRLCRGAAVRASTPMPRRSRPETAATGRPLEAGAA